MNAEAEAFSAFTPPRLHRGRSSGLPRGCGGRASGDLEVSPPARVSGCLRSENELSPRAAGLGSATDQPTAAAHHRLAVRPPPERELRPMCIAHRAGQPAFDIRRLDQYLVLGASRTRPAIVAAIQVHLPRGVVAAGGRGGVAVERCGGVEGHARQRIGSHLRNAPLRSSFDPTHIICRTVTLPIKYARITSLSNSALQKPTCTSREFCVA